MQIINALDITALVNQSGRHAETFPLSSLEELFFAKGLENGSFCIFKVIFSDKKTYVYFDYPTDMSVEDAFDLAKKALVPESKYLDNYF